MNDEYNRKTDYFGPPLTEGMSVRVRFLGNSVTMDAKIAVVDGRTFLCQNYIDGAIIPNDKKYGYSFSYVIDDPYSHAITLKRHNIESIISLEDGDYEIF